MQGRRLDYDCKKRTRARGIFLIKNSTFINFFKSIFFNITDEEIRGAEEKFAESLQLAQVGMFTILENDVRFCSLIWFDLNIIYIKFQVEQISQLAVFAEALLDYHQQCTEILRGLVETMNTRWVVDFSRKLGTIVGIPLSTFFFQNLLIFWSSHHWNIKKNWREI